MFSKKVALEDSCLKIFCAPKNSFEFFNDGLTSFATKNLESSSSAKQFVWHFRQKMAKRISWV